MVVFFVDVVIAEFFFAILADLWFRLIGGERDVFAVLGPCEASHIGFGFCELPGFTARGRDDPDLVRRGFAAALSFLAFFRFFFRLGRFFVFFLVFSFWF